MNKWTLIVVLILAVVAITMIPSRESYLEREFFGLSGYVRPREIALDDKAPDLEGFQEVETKVNNDLMNEFVMKTAAEIERRTKMCVAIIETTTVKRYQKEGQELYECQFMALKKGGFPFAFAVVSTLSMKGGSATVIGLRTQPVGVQAPSDVKAYEDTGDGREFLDYRFVTETTPRLGELEEAKN
jgi:hypothetical protein